MIEAYSFGTIKIDGEEYTNDVKIFPTKVKSNWWRKEGHQLNPEDIEDIIKKSPDVLIVGTGSSNRMIVPEKTKEFIQSNGIELVVQGTKEACETYNKTKYKKETVAALHLTC